MDIPKQTITPFLMFTGKAEEAMNFYISTFDQSEIQSISHQENGQVLHATFTLKGQTFMCIDNSTGAKHDFSPALSLYVTCDSHEEIDRTFAKLAQDGFVMMPLGSYPFSEKFGWVADKYGVSWQLTLGTS